MDDPRGRRPTSIAVLPIGAVPEDELKLIDCVLAEDLRAPVLRLAPVKTIPEAAFNRNRQQHDGDWLLNWLFDRIPSECVRILAVIDADIFADNRNFVYGYGHMKDGMALYSPVRLREKFHGRRADPLREHLRSRAAILHEIGHTCGVVHCNADDCVMSQVATLAELDLLGPGYCPACGRRVNGELNLKPTDAVATYRRIRSLFRRERYPDALAICRQAVSRFPADARLRYELAIALAGLADWDGAGASFDEAVRLDPTYAAKHDDFEKFIDQCKAHRGGR